MQELLARLRGPSGRPFSHGEPVDNASHDRCLVPRREGREDSDESLARGTLVLIGVDVEVTVLMIEGRMGGGAEVAEVPARAATVLLDQPSHFHALNGHSTVRFPPPRPR